MLNVEHLSFSYPGRPVFSDFSLSLQNGELLAVMGPSGCGKTTLLRLIAGLEKPTSGSLWSDFQNLAFVFQDPRLFPWLTVRENLLAVLPKSVKDREERVKTALENVRLTDYANAKPEELSGGMQMRVSLARALCTDADLLLLDEPFAALDVSLREELLDFCKDFCKKCKVSAILVTHQITDAKRFADRITEIKKAGSPV